MRNSSRFTSRLSGLPERDQPGVPARFSQTLRTRELDAPAGERKPAARLRELSASGCTVEEHRRESSCWPQPQLAAALRTGAAGRRRGRQAPPRLLAPATLPMFRALDS